jgi:hypothetical protein
MTPVHAKLETSVREGYKHARHNIDRTLEDAMVDCCATVSDKLGEKFEVLSLQELPFESFSSTLAMSKKAIRIDLVTERSWAFWRRQSIDIARTVDAMKAMAMAEMRPAIEKLVGAFNEAQSERASAGLDRVALLQKMMESSFDERSRRLKTDQKYFAEMADNEVLRTQVLGRLQSQLEVLERRLQLLSVHESTLNGASLQKAA